MEMVSKKVVCVALLCMVVIAAAPGADAAITCGQVTSALAPCINYLKSPVPGVPPACCSGVRGLASQAKSTPDRQSACKCLKTASGSISGLNLNKAAGLPGACGVSIPYKISPSTDCNKVT